MSSNPCAQNATMLSVPDIPGTEPERAPSKHDARWTLGFAREARVPEPLGRASRRFDVGTRRQIIQEGDHARFVFLIVEGSAIVSKLLPDGRRQIVELIGPGDVFGFTTSRTHDCSVETLTATRLVAYDRSALENSPALQWLIAERLKAQLCALHDHAVLLGRKSAVERVATFLMRLLAARGGPGCIGPQPSSDRAQVGVPLTRQDIADYLGLTLETVSRAFSALKRLGVLSYGRHDTVTICDVCSLCRLTGAH
jgi:CRP-like cAMP-binding protein